MPAAPIGAELTGLRGSACETRRTCYSGSQSNTANRPTSRLNLSANTLQAPTLRSAQGLRQCAKMRPITHASIPRSHESGPSPSLRLSCLLVRLVGHCVGSTTLALERIACSSSTAALRRLSGSTFFRASAPEDRLPASRLISPVILSLSALSVWMNSTSDASASIVITRPLGSLTSVISSLSSSPASLRPSSLLVVILAAWPSHPALAEPQEAVSGGPEISCATACLSSPGTDGLVRYTCAPACKASFLSRS